MLPSRPESLRSVRARRGRPGRARSARGQSLVELALVLPLFALLLLMAIDFGRVYFTYIQVNNAAREAANYAATSPTGPTDSAGILAAATQEVDAQSQGGARSVTIPSAVCNDSAGNVINCTDAQTVNATGRATASP